jgi:hypothetical protein
VQRARSRCQPIWLGCSYWRPSLWLGARSGLDKGAASRPLANPIRQGYVKNLEMRRGHPGAYVPGDPLPDQISGLPTAEALQATWEREPEAGMACGDGE